MPCSSARAAFGSEAMLAFDIETTGLNRCKDKITCACAYDPERGISRKFIFPQDGQADDPEAFLVLLDEAPGLCAFNGVSFDVPFICAQWGVDPGRVDRWMRKLVDVFFMCKKTINRTFGLNALLQANGMEGKTGSGADALVLAREGKWDELAEYCLQDCVKTREVTVLPRIILPFRPGNEDPGWVLENLAFARRTGAGI